MSNQWNSELDEYLPEGVLTSFIIYRMRHISLLCGSGNEWRHKI